MRMCLVNTTKYIRILFCLYCKSSNYKVARRQSIPAKFSHHVHGVSLAQPRLCYG